MATTSAPATEVPVPLAEACDVCNARHAVWVSAAHRDFAVCEDCRLAEPCDRCGAERHRCACAEGPDVFVWLPIAG